MFTSFSFDDFPTAEEIALTSSLDQLLKLSGTYETAENERKRKTVVERIKQLFDRWVRDLGLKKNVPEALLSKAGTRVLPFGSVRLGVNGQSSDIDILCIAPDHVNRKDFFTSFGELLKNHNGISDLSCVADAFVPVVTMTFHGIDVDLLFARLPMPFIPADLNLTNDALLLNMNKKCVRSLNGYRVTEKILQLLPNIDAFKMTLRAVKLWAKKRQIYSNVLGYLGGISWALLVAKTCQQYPRAMPATLLQKFFYMFSEWHWPRPVLISEPSQFDVNIPDTPSWDPRININDALQFMPIITPSYPHINSSYNVSQSSMIVIKKELERGLEIVNKKTTWNKLFEPRYFFRNHRHFLVITIEALNERDHQAWQGLFQTKLKFLARQLETNKFIETVHINTDSFPVKGFEKNKSRWFVGFDFVQTKGLNVDLRREIATFVRSVEESVGFPVDDGKAFKIEYASRKQLVQFVELETLLKHFQKVTPIKRELEFDDDSKPPSKRQKN